MLSRESCSVSVSVSLMLSCEVGCAEHTVFDRSMRGQSRWHQTRSVVVRYLQEYVSFQPFIGTQDQPHVAGQHVMKDNAANFDCFFFLLFCSRDHSSETAPYTSSEPVDSRPSTQEGKQTSQESASTSKSLRYNLAPVKNVDCHRLVEGPKLDSSVTVLPIGLAQNSAGLFLKTHSHCISIPVCSVMLRLTADSCTSHAGAVTV